MVDDLRTVNLRECLSLKSTALDAIEKLVRFMYA